MEMSPYFHTPYPAACTWITPGPLAEQAPNCQWVVTVLSARLAMLHAMKHEHVTDVKKGRKQ